MNNADETSRTNPLNTGLLPKLTFTGIDEASNTPKKLYTVINNELPTKKYTRLMNCVGCMTFCLRQGFTHLEGKDEGDQNVVSNAARLLASLARKYYPKEYAMKQLVSANMYKKLIHDAAR